MWLQVSFHFWVPLLLFHFIPSIKQKDKIVTKQHTRGCQPCVCESSPLQRSMLSPSLQIKALPFCLFTSLPTEMRKQPVVLPALCFCHFYNPPCTHSAVLAVPKQQAAAPARPCLAHGLRWHHSRMCVHTAAMNLAARSTAVCSCPLWRHTMIKAFPASGVTVRTLPMQAHHHVIPTRLLLFLWHKSYFLFPAACFHWASWSSVKICLNLESSLKVTGKGQTATYTLTVQSWFP